MALLFIWLGKVPIQFPFKSSLAMSPYMVPHDISMPPGKYAEGTQRKYHPLAKPN